MPACRCRTSPSGSPSRSSWVAGLLFLLGFQTRLVALGLAVFCVVTALIAHTNFGDREQMINFMKNLCMAGGFLAFLAAGGGVFSLDALLRRRTVVARV